MYVADSTFIIDILRKNPDAKKLLDTLNNIIITQFTFYEIMTGVQNCDDKKRLFTRHILSSCSIMPTTIDTMEKTAELNAELIKSGKRIGEIDTFIAGTALTFSCNKIITRNKKHFEHIPGIEVIEY